MTPYNRRLNPYIRRMSEDMQLRNLAPSTIDAYTYHVDKSCRFFGKPADGLGLDETGQYQLYLVNEKKASWSSFSCDANHGANSAGSNCREKSTTDFRRGLESVPKSNPCHYDPLNDYDPRARSGNDRWAQLVIRPWSLINYGRWSP